MLHEFCEHIVVDGLLLFLWGSPVFYCELFMLDATCLRDMKVNRLEAVIYAVIHPISTVERDCHGAYHELKATCMFVLKGAQQRMRWLDKGRSCIS